MPEFNYPEKIINIFLRMKNINPNNNIKDSNIKLKSFVQEYIGLSKYSFHQINIFIKFFISQYNQFKSKLKFFKGEKDVTEECISNS